MSVRFPYRRRHRVRLSRDYAAAFDARLKKSAGPLTVFGRPNGLAEHRLGLSVGRRVGPAVRRARTKRLIREAFRLSRAGLPLTPDGTAYDLVVSVRPHGSASLSEVRGWLEAAATQIDRAYRRRLGREGAADAS